MYYPYSVLIGNNKLICMILKYVPSKFFLAYNVVNNDYGVFLHFKID